MKRLILSFILLISFIACKTEKQYQKPMPYVDERIELMNIVFRLANVPKYQDSVIKTYVKAIDSYFAAYKEHELIKYTRQLWNKYGISTDAVATYAVMLDIKDGKIAFIKNGILELGPRWQGDAPNIFLKKLNDFYTESDFHQFFKNNAQLYQEAVEHYNRGYTNTDFKWFDNYFGEKSGTKDFKVILNLLDKAWNYGPKVKYANHQKETAYAIICTSEADSSDLPIYDDWSYNVVVHELIHSYANHLIDQYASSFDSIKNVFYNYSANRLRRVGVGQSKLFLYETLVRACEIQYHKANSDTLLWRKRLNTEMVSGFLWLDTLCNLMTKEYEPNRTAYPDMGSFIPRMAEVLNTLSPEELSINFLSKAVHITGSSITNGDKNVDPATKKLIISFDKTMQTGKDSFGIWPGEQGKKAVPEITQILWSQDAKQLIMDIQLEPDKAYSILFPEYFFMSADYEPLKNPMHVEFNTSR